MKKKKTLALKKTQAKKMGAFCADAETGYPAGFKHMSADVQDEMQETFLRICKTVAKNDTEIEGKHYVNKVRKTVRIDNWRKNGSHTFISLGDTDNEKLIKEITLMDQNALDKLLHDSENERLKATLEKCLKGFTEFRKHLVNLHRQNHTNQEIAMILGLPIETVKLEKNRAMAAFRKRLRNELMRRSR